MFCLTTSEEINTFAKKLKKKKKTRLKLKKALYFMVGNPCAESLLLLKRDLEWFMAGVKLSPRWAAAAGTFDVFSHCPGRSSHQTNASSQPVLTYSDWRHEQLLFCRKRIFIPNLFIIQKSMFLPIHRFATLYYICPACYTVSVWGIRSWLVRRPFQTGGRYLIFEWHSILERK